MPQQVLAKDFAGFQLGGRPRRAERSQPRLLKRVDQAGRQRRFGADDREVDLVLLAQTRAGAWTSVAGMSTFSASSPCRRCPAQRTHARPRALADLPRQRVFATTVANNKNLHRVLRQWIRGRRAQCERRIDDCARCIVDATVPVSARAGDTRQLCRAVIRNTIDAAIVYVSRRANRARNNLIFTSCVARRRIGGRRV